MTSPTRHRCRAPAAVAGAVVATLALASPAVASGCILQASGGIDQRIAPGEPVEWIVQVSNLTDTPVDLTVELRGGGHLATHPDGLRVAADLCRGTWRPDGDAYRCTGTVGPVVASQRPPAGPGATEPLPSLAGGGTLDVRLTAALPIEAGNDLQERHGSVVTTFAAVGDTVTPACTPGDAAPPAGDRPGGDLVPTGAPLAALAALGLAGIILGTLLRRWPRASSGG